MPLTHYSIKTQITVWPPGVKFTLSETFGSCDSSQAETDATWIKRLSHFSTVATGLFHAAAPLIASRTVPDWDTSTNY